MSELVMLFHPFHPLVTTIPSSRLKMRPHTDSRAHYHVTSLTSVQMVVITKGGDATAPHCPEDTLFTMGTSEE